MKRLLITLGEPAGIGADIILTALTRDWPVDLMVVGDAHVLENRAKQLGLSSHIHKASLADERRPHAANIIRVLPVACAAPVVPGQLDQRNAAFVLDTLKIAADACLANQADALVTAPVQKNIINEAGFAFSGHTEFFAACAGVAKTVMLFVAEKNLRVALATTHLPLANVPSAITPALLTDVITTLREGLVRWFGVTNPSILVCGLNPHAGENGQLGREEIEVITPTLDALRAQGFNLSGPVSADTAFSTPGNDVVLALYHDQALPVVKYASFGHAVNVTLGLPFLRTSVDHGTALSLAGSGQADATSLIAALQLALEHCHR